MSHYYNENAKAFFEGTAYVDMSENQKKFIAQVPAGGKILDAGCGSGRDALCFKQEGYQVIAMDGAIEMCKLASAHIGQEVLHLQFQEVTFENEFDGIWASASLLHVPSSELQEVLMKLKKGLKSGGAFYASFKYGEFEGERNGRYFHDLTEESAKTLFTQVGLKVVKMWITSDVREGRGDEKWVNIIVRK